MPTIRNATINGIPCTAAHTRIGNLRGSKDSGFDAELYTYASTAAFQSGYTPICSPDSIHVDYIAGQDPYVTVYTWAEANLYAGQVVI